MTIQPKRESLRRHAYWKVQYVRAADPRQAYAYTVGLADSGLPELYMKAVPIQPRSADAWTFSPTDCARQLNAFAQQLIAGELVVGQSFSRSYDADTTTVVWTPGARTAPEHLEAGWVDADGTVIPMIAQLQPPVLEPPTVFTAPEWRRWRREVDRVLAEVPRRHGVAGFPAPAAHAPSESGIGPLAPLVQAYAHAVSRATPATLAVLLDLTMDTERCFGARSVLAVCYAKARVTQRVAAVQRAEQQARALVDALRGPGGTRADWRKMLHCSGFSAADDRRGLSGGVGAVLLHAVTALLAAAAVADRLDERTALAAFGPWSAAVDPRDVAPGPRHWAPAHVRTALRACLPADLGTVVDAWEEVRDSHLAALLRALSVTGARGCPPPRVLLGTRLSPGDEWALSEFLNCATALLSERALFDAGEVAEFCAPLADALPLLESVLNAPLESG